MTTEPHRATVLVAVEGMPASGAAIRLADQEARYRHAALVAVMAYSAEHPLGAPAGRPVSVLRSPGEDRLIAESALYDAVTDALGGEAGQVELRTLPGPAGRNFVAAARDVNAQLIVLAGRGAASMLPGTTGQHVLQRAPCPVVIVPAAGMVA